MGGRPGLQDQVAAAAQLEQAYRAIVGQEYPVSEDSTTMVLKFYPTGSKTNISFIEDAYEDLEALAAEMNPASYHPEMQVVAAGRLLRQAVEVRAITSDLFQSFGSGVGAVLLAVMLYFFYKAYQARAGHRWSPRILGEELLRAPLMALVIGLPLLMSLAWTFGFAYLAYGTLNLMTSTLGLVLFGLGIDYGIHFYARYAEERGTGHGVLEAAEHTFVSTGQAITVGGLTTAAALYVLVVADFKGFSEFGLIAGTGILFALVAMTLVLPALLAVAWAVSRWPGGLTVAAGWLFVFGIVVFSGTVYALGLGGPRWLGAITPIGGVSFILGWALLAWAALRGG